MSDQTRTTRVSRPAVATAPPASAAQAWFWLLGALTVVGALAVRIAASRNDFWLDEIWSWIFARNAASLREVFTLRHDNSHVLNTVLLYLLGDRSNWIVYRIPAIVAGTATVVVGGLIGLRRNRVDAIVTMLLLAGSYLLVLYSSEARGYGLVMFFSVAGFYLIESGYGRGGVLRPALFAVCTWLGFLSHATFLHFYAAALLWSGFKLLRDRGSTQWGSRIIEFVRWHALPLAGMAVVYWICYHNMGVGGGPPYSAAQILAGVASLSIGGPESGTLAWFAAGAAVIMLLVGITLMTAGKSDHWLFFAVMLAIPIVVVLVRPKILFVRYFLVVIVFFLVLVGRTLGELWQRMPKYGPAFASLVIAVVVAANALQTYRLIRLGRGEYHQAVTYIAEHSAGLALVGGDHDFRNSMVVWFYARHLPENKPVVYLPHAEWPAGGPEWLLCHDQSREQPAAEARKAAGHLYRLVKSYDYAGMSGWRWFIYHNEGPVPNGAS